MKSKPFVLIETFARVWCENYHGEIYEKTGKDFRNAKLYLDLNGDFNADNIISKAKIYLKMGGIYASENVRHNFSAFINNISTFVAEKKIERRIQMWTCEHCQEIMPEGKQYAHWDVCPEMRRASPEQVREIMENINDLSKGMKA